MHRCSISQEQCAKNIEGKQMSRSETVINLRSRTHMPDGTVLQQEREEWTGSVAALGPEDFEALMVPLLANGRVGLIGLPEWSRSVLAARFLGAIS